jgi:hypothetical protein
MTVSGWIQEFDKGVEEARQMYHAGPAAAFDDEFAAFTIYDTTAAETSISEPLFLLVPEDRPHKQPQLWRRLHKPLGQILRNEVDLSPYYAGFATLFTLNRGRDGTRDAPDYLSMSIDAPLRAPGMHDLKLTRLQFHGTVATRPLPLTAVCLNAADDRSFETVPVVFYWRGTEDPTDESWGKVPEGLETWGHVFVSEAIPEDDETGLKTQPDQWGFHSSLLVAQERNVAHGCAFTRSVVLQRLEAFYESLANGHHQPTTELELEHRLAWTVTYFAYACRRNLQEGLIAPRAPGRPLDHLAIVCAPASYDPLVGAALYLPLACRPSDPGLSRAALKAFYLARTVGLPLERLRWEDTATEQTLDTFRHQTSAAIDSVVGDFQGLPTSLRTELGGHLLARLYLLRTTIHAYNRADPYAFEEAFNYPWQDSDCPLDIYGEIGLQLGFARARRASAREPRVRLLARSAAPELRRSDTAEFRALLGQYFEPRNDECFAVHEHAKNEAFAVLMMLAIQQAVYHTIRAQGRGSTGRISLEIAPAADRDSLTCVVRNPSVPGSRTDTVSRDEAELRGLAQLFSREGRYQYNCKGPVYDQAGGDWVTEVSMYWRLPDGKDGDEVF